ncbi:MAG: hypothetical protein ACTHJ0_10890 [Flavipsychrobacter sp.]
MIKFLSAVMLTMTFLFVAPKAHAYKVPVSGSAWTSCCGFVVWEGWLEDGGIHGHIHTNVGDKDWIIINPHTDQNGNVNHLDTYQTFSDFEANNSIVGGDLDPNTFLTVYNDFANHFNSAVQQ